MIGSDLIDNQSESELFAESSDLHVEEIMNEESIELNPKCETIMEADSF